MATKRVSIRWFDDELAGVVCVCGTEVLATIQGSDCERCGRRLRLIQRVVVETPNGRCCRHCGKLLYSRHTRTRYCSGRCGIAYRRQQRQRD